MANGTILLAKSANSGSYIEGKVVWSAVADEKNNCSKVTATLYVRKDSFDTTLTIPTEGNWAFSIDIGGSKKSGTVNLAVLTDWVKVAQHSVSAIAHDSRGEKTVSISGSVTPPSISSYAGHITDGAEDVELDSISCSDMITAASDTRLGQAVQVQWVPRSADYHYRLAFSIGNWSDETEMIHPGQTGLFTFSGYELPMEVANQIDGGNADTMTVRLYTYEDAQGTKQIGAVSEAEFLAIIPVTADVLPQFEMTLVPVSSLGESFAGLYVQGYTQVQAQIQAEGQYGASVDEVYIIVDGLKYDDDDDDLTSEYLAQSGTVNVTGCVRDSRANQARQTQQITVLPYSKPRILITELERCDATGSPTDEGSYVTIRAWRYYSPVVAEGVQKNYCAIQCRWKESGTQGSAYSQWQTILERTAGADEVQTGALFGGALLPAKAYTVQIRAVDDIGNTAVTTVTVEPESVYWHRDGKRRSFSFGEYVQEDDTFAISKDATFKAKGPAVLSRDTSIGGYPAEAVRQCENGCVLLASGLLIQWGRVQIIPAAATPTESEVLFDNAYAQAPFVIANALTAVPGTQVLGVAVTGITGEGCTLVLTRNDETETGVRWLAIGICAEDITNEEEA